jgi:hypothetical protein
MTTQENDENDSDSRINPAGDIKMWLDDLRPAPSGWQLVKNYDEAVHLLERGRVTTASLDHDLSDIQMRWDTGSGYCEAPVFRETEMTGYDVVKWMAQHNVWPQSICVHSGNPVGKKAMLQLIERCHPEGAGAIFSW